MNAMPPPASPDTAPPPELGVERPGDGVAVVRLNRPAATNALSLSLQASLLQAFTELAADDTVRAIVLTGAGGAFCSGIDIRDSPA